MIDFKLYVINKNVVTSIQDKIDEVNKKSSYNYGYIPLELSQEDYKYLKNHINVTENNELCEFDYVIYLGQYPKFDNCKLFLLHKKLNQIDQIHEFYYIYLLNKFGNWIYVKYGPDYINKINSDDIPLNGFFDHVHLFAYEFIEYYKSNQLHAFMYKYNKLTYEKQFITDIAEAEEPKYEPSENSDWVKLATVGDEEYTLIMRQGKKEKYIVCNCPDFFFRDKNAEQCEHIERFLYVSDDVPEGELFPEDVEATIDGKDFVVRYRIDNDFDVFKR